jgi:hypothetical protein
MKLTTEQINEILAGELKPNSLGHYTPPKFVPKQVGPIRFLPDSHSQKCIHTGYYKEGEHIKTKVMCGAPAYLTVYGERMCLLHAVMVLNLKLYEMEAA